MMIRAPIPFLAALLVALLLFTSCCGTSCPPNYVKAEPYAKSVERLAPYTELGIQTAEGLTTAQRENLLLQLQVLRSNLNEAAEAKEEPAEPNPPATETTSVLPGNPGVAAPRWAVQGRATAW